MKKIIIVICLCILCGCQDNVIINNTPTQENNGIIIINVQGAINNPGLYEVEKGLFLYQLIEIAGGLRSDADIESFNAVDVIDVSTTIRILSLQSDGVSNLVNINTAGISELMLLPGIGEAKATLIIEYRNVNGRFLNIEEIKNVSGIGESVFNTLKSYITI